MSSGDSKRLAGKVAIITGASKGIGASIAEKFAFEGANVVVNYNSDERGAQAVVDRIQATGGGGKAFAVQANVGNANDAQHLVERTVGEFGKLDILVNNAGVFDFAPLAEITAENFDKHFNTNVKGLLFVTQSAVSAFGEAGGRIINISSVVAQMPPPNSVVYSATKGAVDTITRALAIELGPKNIQVNSLSPGFTETEGATELGMPPEAIAFMVSHTALGRAGKPLDISNAAALLASDEAGWITGQIIEVSGGIRM